jgi:hypothetical protein
MWLQSVALQVFSPPQHLVLQVLSSSKFSGLLQSDLIEFMAEAVGCRFEFRLRLEPFYFGIYFHSYFSSSTFISIL